MLGAVQLCTPAVHGGCPVTERCCPVPILCAPAAYRRSRPAAPQTAVDSSGALFRSSASSWWAYSSTSSLTSTIAAAGGQGLGASSVFQGSSSFPSSTQPGSSYPGAAGNSSVSGVAGGAFAGLAAAGSMLSGIGLGSSFPPGPTPGSYTIAAYGNAVNQTSPMASAEPSVTSRAMRLSSTFTSVFGMAGGGGAAGPASTPVPGAGTGAPTGSFADLQEGSLQGFGGAVGGGSLSGQVGPVSAPRAATEQSDSTRSSLSITGQGSTAAGADGSGAGAAAAALSASTNLVAAAGAGAAAGSASATLPQAVNVGGGRAGPSSSTEYTAAGGNGAFSLGSYYGTGLGPTNIREQRSGVLSDDGGWGTVGQAGLGDRGRRPSRQATREPPSPVLRGLVTRPELALCLLTEVSAQLCHLSFHNGYHAAVISSEYRVRSV